MGQVMLGQALNTQKSSGHSDKQERVFWAREQPRQRPRGGKELEIMRTGNIAHVVSVLLR